MRRCRPWLGTFVEIECDSETAIDAGFAPIEAVHRSMSAHEAASELSCLNRGERISPSPDFAAVIERAFFWFQESGGLFDPAEAGAAALACGALPLHPGQRVATMGTSLAQLHIEGGEAWLDGPACLDLGGIAKGHAVDRAVAAMIASGASRGLVNAGGDMRAFGAAAPIDIVDPLNRAPLFRVMLENSALATSAGHPAAGRLDFAHLRSRSAFVSVSVEAPRAIDADALTKIVFARPSDLSRLLALASARAVAIDDLGAIVDPVAMRDAA